MKTATVLLMVVALSMLLAGCASNSNKNPYLGQAVQAVPTHQGPQMQQNPPPGVGGCGFAAVDAEAPIGGVVGVAL